jgi:hypothetical protein
MDVNQNTGGESEEFLSAVSEPDSDFVPSPDDWFVATLAYRLRHAAMVIANLSNGEKVLIHERNISAKPGHGLCLPPGTPAAVRLELNPRATKWRFRAIECQIEGEPMETHGRGFIEHWTGSLGSARMTCGCSVMIATANKNDTLDLKIGDEVEFKLKFLEKKNTWIGGNIRPIKEQE